MANKRFNLITAINKHMKITEVIQPIKPKTLDQIRIDQLTKVSTTAKDAVKRERKRQKIQKASATLQKLQTARTI
jgi:hypothetical protein